MLLGFLALVLSSLRCLSPARTGKLVPVLHSDVDPHVPGCAGPGAAGLSGGRHRAVRPPGVARGLGSCARASPPADAARASPRASGARALRTHKAAGRAAAGGRSAGERAARQPSPRPRHRSSSHSGAGTWAGPQGTCRRKPAPQLGVVGTSPRPPGGPGVSPRARLAKAAGRARRDHPSRCPRPPLPEPGPPVAHPGAGHSVWGCGWRPQGSSFLGRGAEAPVRERLSRGRPEDRGPV